MAETKRWMWPGAGVLTLLLIVWGLWGEGTASKLFPEKEAASSAISVSASATQRQAAENGDEESKQRYDATLHHRGKPLADPFHSDAVSRASERGKEKSPVASPSVREAASASTTKESKQEKRSAYPTLLGVMQLGEKKRAVIAWNGENYTAGEGEQVGIWKISAIEGKTVRLIGPPGTLELSTR